MKNLKILGLLGLMMSLVLLVPNGSQAEPNTGDPCEQHKDKDQLNLCRAFEIDKAKTDEQKQNRYQNKNHTTYYCSLIKDRELQKFCFAVASQSKTQCGNIVDPKLEQECNDKIK
ncbi:MAG: hypothetical protein OEZ51_12400 [Nitrospinota bacterium]|nr:hypothetical protein [Nitrospinota bacterium]